MFTLENRIIYTHIRTLYTHAHIFTRVYTMQVIALSCNDSESHMGWIEDIKAAQGISTFSYPIIADPKRELAVAWGMVTTHFIFWRLIYI